MLNSVLFPTYNIMIQHLYTLQRDPHIKSSNHLTVQTYTALLTIKICLLNIHYIGNLVLEILGDTRKIRNGIFFLI